MDGNSSSTHDEIPYHSQPYRLCHPDNLATMAILCGGDHEIRRSGFRVLEIGCGAGNNIIPLAYSIPHAQFVGVDLTPSYILQGQELVARLKLTNIELRSQDLASIDQQIGAFDYIIAHGVHSWVDRIMQSHLFRICAECLTPRGVAYISYNSYPGWHIRNVIRDALLFIGRNASSAKVKIRLARSFINRWMVELQGEDIKNTEFLRSELAKVQTLPDWYLLHDLLEGVNDPIYLHDFIAAAQEHGLYYLADAEPSLLNFHDLTSSAVEALNSLTADRASCEQYADFLRLRTFRRSLITRYSVEVNADILEGNLASLLVSVPPSSNFTAFNHGTQQIFHSAQQQWPSRLGVRALYGDQLTTLSAELLAAYQRGIVELHAFANPCAVIISETPTASALARLQAQSSEEVTNLAHEIFVLGDLEREVLCLLDGSHNRSAIVQAIRKRATRGGDTAEIGEKVDTILELFRMAMLFMP